MTEPELRQRVFALCGELGLLWHYCPSARFCQGPPGLPDLLIAGSRDLVLAELKSAGGDTSAEQDLWLWTVGGKRSVVWRPADLESGRIASWLADLV